MPPASRPYLIRSILSSLVSMSASQLLVLADWLTGSCAEEGLIEQKYVQRDYEEDDHCRYGRGEAVVDERAHNVPVAAEDEQRNERERDAEGEHHLAYDQRTAGVEANGQDDQGRHHGDETAQEQRYLPAYEPLHDALPTQGTDGRARKPRGEQGDPEQDGRSVALQNAQLLEGLVYVADACEPGRVEEGCSHYEHARIDVPAMAMAMTTSTSSKRKIL